MTPPPTIPRQPRSTRSKRSLVATIIAVDCARTAPLLVGGTIPIGKRSHRPVRPEHHLRRKSYVWAAHRRFDHLLGRQLVRASHRSNRQIPSGHQWLGPYVRTAHGRTITCWGANSSGQTTAPSGSFQAVSAGGGHYGDRGFTRADCAPMAQSPVGATTDTAKATRRLDRSKPFPPVDCIRAGCAPMAPSPAGAPTVRPSDAPTGSFKAVTASFGWGHSCGLRTDDTITCWGRNARGTGEAPRGTFQAVSAGSNQTCGVRTDGAVTCWGSNFTGRTDAPAGTFKTLAAGTNHTCAIRTDDTVTCWGNSLYGQIFGPTRSFKTVSVNDRHSCGVRVDNSITCRGDDSHGKTDAPAPPVP